MISLEPYHQSHTYDTGNNLIHLSHQAKSNTWQQTLTIHPNSNRGTETQQSTSDFDANGNLLNLNNNYQVQNIHTYLHEVAGVRQLLRQSITNPSTNEAIEIYLTDRNYPKFYRNFLKNSDNGRFSLKVTNTFSLKTTSIKLKNNGDDIRLYLKPKMPLISAEEPLRYGEICIGVYQVKFISRISPDNIFQSFICLIKTQVVALA
jgi:hypothetical protein